MTQRNQLWLACMLALGIACGALARQLGVERDHTRIELDRIAGLQTRIGALGGGAQAAGSRIGGATRSPSAGEAPKKADPRQPAAAPTATAESRGPPDPNADWNRRMEAQRAAQAKMYADPEGRRLMLAESKINMRAEYPDVARFLNLSSDEADQLFALLAQQRLNFFERPANGASPDDFEQRMRADDAELASLLGSERFQKLQRYRDTSGERSRVAAFREQLDEAHALSDDTAERLITVLATERERADAKRQAESGSPRGMVMGFASGVSLYIDPATQEGLDSAMAHLESYDRSTAQVVSPLLTSAQLKSFTAFQRKQREHSLAQARMMLMDSERRRTQTP